MEERPGRARLPPPPHLPAKDSVQQRARRAQDARKHQAHGRLRGRRLCCLPRGETACVRAQSYLTLCDPVDCSPARLRCPWDSPGQNTGAGCHSPSPRGSSQPRDQTRSDRGMEPASFFSCAGRQILDRLMEFLATPHRNARLEWLIMLI